jgi:hypothetical protein
MLEVFPSRDSSPFQIIQRILLLLVLLANRSAAQSSPVMRDFQIEDRGSVSLAATADNLLNGYTRIQVTSGSTLPAGMAILRSHQSGALLSQASIPAMPVLMSGRVYAEVTSSVSTGIAIVNLNSQPVTINFYFTDTAGSSTRQGATVVGANSKIVGWLNESPFNGGSIIQGTFTFTSSSFVSAIAFHRRINHLNEFLMTSFPVIDLSAPPTGTQTVPHFAFSANWSTNLIFVNPTDAAISGTIQAFAPTGETASAVYPGTYAIPARSSLMMGLYVVPQVGQSIPTGSLRIIPTSAGPPSVIALFAYGVQAGLFRPFQLWTYVAVPVTAPSTSSRLFVESVGSPSELPTQTGIAIANPNMASANIALELFSADGTSTGLRDNIALPANGQTALFINQIPGLSSVGPAFRGVLRVTSSFPVSLMGLLGTYNERATFIATPTFPIAEAEIQKSSELSFPHFLAGSGYETEFVLFSSKAPSSGTVYFYDQNGDAPSLTFNP